MDQSGQGAPEIHGGELLGNILKSLIRLDMGLMKPLKSQIDGVLGDIADRGAISRDMAGIDDDIQQAAGGSSSMGNSTGCVA